MTSELEDQIDQAYCHDPTDSFYMPCSGAVALPEQRQYDPSGEDEQSFEIVSEYWRGNCPF